MKKLEKNPFGDGFIIWDEDDCLGGCSKWMENLLLILFCICILSIGGTLLFYYLGLI